MAKERHRAPVTQRAIENGYHDSDSARRAMMAAAFASELEVGCGTVIRIRLSPRAWQEALQRHNREALAKSGFDQDELAMSVPAPPSAEQMTEKAEPYLKALEKIVEMQKAATAAREVAELLAIEELFVGVVRSEIPGVTKEDVMATPEMVERIVDAFKATVVAKDKKGEAGAASPAAGPSSEAAAVAN